MKNRHADTGSPAALIRPILTGVIAGAIVTFAALLICALLFTIKDFSASAAGPMAAVSAGLGALAAGFAAAKSHKRQGLTIGLAAGMLLFVVVLLVSLFVSESGFTVLTAIKLAVMALASAIGGVIGVNSATKRKMV